MTDRKQDIVERLRECEPWGNPGGDSFACLADDAADKIEWLEDKVEGLTADLHNAVQTAYNRGAHEWTRLNYPQWIDWMESQAAPPCPSAPGSVE